MKNPLGKVWHAARVIQALRREGVSFRLGDALLQWEKVLMPARFTYALAACRLRKEAVVTCLDNVYRICLPKQNLTFFWPEPPTPNLHHLIDQEFNSCNPHYYTTPPVVLRPDSLILDVGACEGLFALRTLKTAMAARVIGFEPSARMSNLLRQAAQENGIEHLLEVESRAVGRSSGTVPIIETGNVLACRAPADGGPENGLRVPSVSLDDYCGIRGLTLRRQDLIKIDAEGMDFEVLLGAERMIRENAPQIAVTTYHHPRHCLQIATWLRRTQPSYQFRLKGFAFWTDPPQPVLLQAACPNEASPQSF